MKEYYENARLPDVFLPRCPIDKKLAGQTEIVTGAGSGIGRATGFALGPAGAWS